MVFQGNVVAWPHMHCNVSELEFLITQQLGKQLGTNVNKRVRLVS